MLHLQACLSPSEDLETIFHCCGGPVSLKEARLCAGKI